MTHPFHIWTDRPAVGLFRLADGRFQLIEDGPVGPLMFGPGYFIVERQLSEFLSDLTLPRVAIEPAVIWHRATGQEFNTHARIVVGQWFAPDQINDLDLDGERLLSMSDEYLFASPALKEKLRASPFSYLRFSEGLSDFAGSSA